MSPNVKKSSKIKSPVVIPKKEKSGKKSATHLIPSNNKNTPSKKKKKSSLTTKKSLTKKKEIEENKNLLKVNNKSLSKLNEEIKDLFNPKSENPDIEDDSETFTDFLKKQEPKQRHFSQESSFSSVSENGKTKSFKSVKGSFSVENPEETKKMCDKMSESNPNIQCTYNEKENVCYLDMTSMVGNIVDTLGMGQKLNDDTQKVKDYLNKMLSSTMIQPRVVPSSSGYSGSPQRMMSPSEHFSPVKKMSPRVFIIQGHLPRPPMSQYQPHRNPHPFMMFGGDSCSIGKQNNCPDNGRLIYDTQGKIDCGNMSNQGGQQFMYPKKITNFVGGHKKSLKKKKQQKGGAAGEEGHGDPNQEFEEYIRSLYSSAQKLKDPSAQIYEELSDELLPEQPKPLHRVLDTLKELGESQQFETADKSIEYARKKRLCGVKLSYIILHLKHNTDLLIDAITKLKNKEANESLIIARDLLEYKKTPTVAKYELPRGLIKV